MTPAPAASRAGVAVAVAAGLAAGLAGCGPELGDAHPWIDAADLDGVLRPELALDREPIPAATDRLRVVTFNAHYGEDVAALAAALTDSPDLAGADVVLMQELEDQPDEGSSRASRLADLLAMNYVYAPARPSGAGTHGLAILSPHPMARVQVMELPHADIGFHSRRRIALAADVEIAGVAVRVVDVHLDTRLGVADRLRQLRPAVIDLDDRVVVGGDLNTLPWAWLEGVVPDLPAQAALDEDAARAVDELMTALDFATPTAALGATDNDPILDARLDSLYPRGLGVRDAAVARDVDASDHFPVRVDLAPP
ncbi:MAG: endonuclease/exonuclease/phosphatase family protein [Kofleriaceae bacterium]|nr:endonuclease/exonuclease/phosphatase family protein [Kofleriaceae bacterium]MCB9573890.1 endonuclease/exonuclease/phosphatase family protein [Kofleriaceae bacterium]